MKIRTILPIAAVALLTLLGPPPASAAPPDHLRQEIKHLRQELRQERRRVSSLRRSRDAARDAAVAPLAEGITALALTAPPRDALPQLEAILRPLAAAWPCRNDASLTGLTEDGVTIHLTLELGTLFAPLASPCAPA